MFLLKRDKSTSINGIARASGISKGQIYEYFDNREEIIFPAITARFTRMDEQIKLMVQEDSDTGNSDPETQLRKTIHSSLELVLDNPGTIKLTASIFQLILTKSPLLKEHDIVRECSKGIRRRIMGILLSVVSRETFRAEIAQDAEKVAINLLAYLYGIALHYYMSYNYCKDF